MQDYTSTVDKRTEQFDDEWVVDTALPSRAREYGYWFGVSLGTLVIGGLVTLLSGSAVVWIVGSVLAASALLCDVSYRRTTYDSHRPHKLFWSTMSAITVLSGGLAGFVVIPMYGIELLLA